ncbi:MAG: hypothetical protein NTZ63_05710 [Candidatus Omnitrophica bacterium]|nr:hypothetical protein [Candidatus Omnitrophota bacterium]
MKKILGGIVLSFVIFMLTGCASNRGYLTVDLPQHSIANDNGKQVFIRSVVDNRIFENRPRTPDVPSLGFKGSDQASKEIKSRAIARKRNGYGRALGDILLDENQSVEFIATEMIKNSLYSLGYTVTNNKDEAKRDAIIMDVSIDKFWSWINVGVWTLRIDAQIKTTMNITFPGDKKTVTIEALVNNPCQMGNTANWRKAIRMVIEAYISEAKDKLKCLEKGC